MPLFGRRKQQPDPEPEAGGWEAIDAALRRVYGDAKPLHMGYGAAPPLGSDLQGCSAYAADGHWHFVTYGLSALFGPGTGYGIELTLRVARGAEDDPPRWAFVVLNQLARYVNGSGTPLLPGERLDAKGAVTGHPADEAAPPTGLTAFAFTEDPVFGTVPGPFGDVTFVQLVGVTGAERERMSEAGNDAVLDGLRAADPLLVTDLARA